MLTKERNYYPVLDGLRGVAALLVLAYHIAEGFAPSLRENAVAHGYLAVDFFFMLSGFVLARAYDPSHSQLGTSALLKKRILRLHPMVVLGVLWGACCFVIQGMVRWDGTAVAWCDLLGATLSSLLLIPAYVGSPWEVRGFGEMFPLDGPMWSLFFEYIISFVYILGLRRLGIKALVCVVAFSALGLSLFGLLDVSETGVLGFGWSLGQYGFWGGLLRVSFAFSAGMLVARCWDRVSLSQAVTLRGLWLGIICFVIVLCSPYWGGEGEYILNTLFDLLVLFVGFPILLGLGAGVQSVGAVGDRVLKFLGRISYPLYIIHYPTFYLFYAWVWSGGRSFAETWWVALLLVAGNIFLASILERYYERPVRRWLTR